MGCFFTILTLVALYAISWALTCGLIYLIAICFGLSITLPIATGVWLVCVLINIAIKRG